MIPHIAPGTYRIAVERDGQKQRWSSQHDDRHDCGELVAAAICYARTTVYGADARESAHFEPRGWPWSREEWKPDPEDPIRNLVRAGALIAAEIDRLERKAARDAVA